ncbi:uncharacterized protein LOC110692697 [Chenopodium quinoa]|uniref:Ycf54 n=1 Tax=Chenopodium quinoa TaxID=63459 RepID=A0A803MCL5_CHEQI|nr:uncharacterized protein LOC110692697 [Chenopodium quinoa]XP_021725427.1 uncharacterized protein LOC110692697 [Chenopodium quinoa]
MVVLASNCVTMNSAAIMGGTLVHTQQSYNKPLFLLPSSRNNSSQSVSLSSLSIGAGIAPSSSLRTPAVAVAADTSQPSSSSEQDQTTKKYYFVVANAKFMLDEEEHFRELMYERLRMFGERNIEQDFWLVIEPKFLEKFPNITKRLKRPAVALVSTNGPWITYMKLRLDRVLAESYEADSIEEALASNPTKLEFEKPEKWVAPYTKYEYGWWETFLPPGSQKSQA